MQSHANSFARIESDLALKVSEFPNQQHFKHKTIGLAFTLFNNRKPVVYVFWTIQCFSLRCLPTEEAITCIALLVYKKWVLSLELGASPGFCC